MTAFELYQPVEDDWEAIRDIRLRALADEPAAFLERLAAVEKFDEVEWRARARRNRAPGSRQLIARVPGGRWVASMTIFTSEGLPPTSAIRRAVSRGRIWSASGSTRSIAASTSGSPTRCCSRSASGYATSSDSIACTCTWGTGTCGRVGSTSDTASTPPGSPRSSRATCPTSSTSSSSTCVAASGVRAALSTRLDPCTSP